MTTPTLTPEQARPHAEKSLVRRSFPDFLSHVAIESDDAAHPGPIRPDWWPYQRERAEAWQAGQSEIWLKRRQIGASWLVSAYMLWVAMYRESRDVGYYSRGQEEARHQLRRRCKYIYDHLPGHLRVRANWTADVASFDGGSSIRVFPSTPDAGIGYTFKLVVFDEAAFHPYGEQNYAAALPTLGQDGQVLVLSTANPELGEYGWFHDLWEQAQAGTVSLSPVFTGRWARPDEDEQLFARRRADFAGSPEGFDAYYPEQPAHAFVGKRGLVFPEFSRQRHVTTFHPFEWEDATYRVAGIDPGGGDPTAVIPAGISGEWRFHQPGEGYWTDGNASISDIIEYLAYWHRRAPFDAIWGDWGPESPMGREIAAAFPGVMVSAGTKDKTARNERHRWVLANDRLTIHESCEYSIHEYAGYRNSVRIDPHSKVRYYTSTPVDHHGDGIDGRGYLLFGAIEALRGNRTGERVEIGYRRATKGPPIPANQPMKLAEQYHRPRKKRVGVR